jgi:hypothetical protein
LFVSGFGDPPALKRWAIVSRLAKDEGREMKDELLSIADYARATRAKLRQDVLDYFEGGARGKG